jgi:hypothetical protein
MDNHKYLRQVVMCWKGIHKYFCQMVKSLKGISSLCKTSGTRMNKMTSTHIPLVLQKCVEEYKSTHEEVLSLYFFDVRLLISLLISSNFLIQFAKLVRAREKLPCVISVGLGQVSFCFILFLYL